MNYWLMKTEPAEWSWDDQVAKGAKGEEWSGVRNYQARNKMREMQVGDRAFFYHSQTDKACVGIVEVTAPAHPDPTDDTGRWDCVTVQAIEPLPRPVTLTEIKADPRLSDMLLVKSPRLSVQPVNEAEWRIICELGGL
ncbi:Predicted RNA-binding protein, contains PUA-like domain [Palleronia marisminoris]|uniref:EVE domain protein n=1 Tax=Palleronia marisminoris TaxID=315423 RepID=A0A1Y5T3P9_9RHOB|nr:EVE domain-containing protein [Palleronia marisminoris]SFH06925.1 Predicted RNA-binding protein, contains PUA-like domain [Palleronia marisminoris]SLN51600.1 EVE domain protein [Palleronia marisminoris]